MSSFFRILPHIYQVMRGRHYIQPDDKFKLFIYKTAPVSLLIHGIQEGLVRFRLSDLVHDKFHGIHGIHFLEKPS